MLIKGILPQLLLLLLHWMWLLRVILVLPGDWRTFVNFSFDEFSDRLDFHLFLSSGGELLSGEEELFAHVFHFVFYDGSVVAGDIDIRQRNRPRLQTHTTSQLPMPRPTNLLQIPQPLHVLVVVGDRHIQRHLFPVEFDPVLPHFFKMLSWQIMVPLILFKRSIVVKSLFILGWQFCWQSRFQLQ